MKKNKNFINQEKINGYLEIFDEKYGYEDMDSKCNMEIMNEIFIALDDLEYMLRGSSASLELINDKKAFLERFIMQK